jgi:hypothetical protein
MEWIESLNTWFFSLSENYGVNPFIFGGIYIGAIPFFTVSVAWIVRNYKRGFSIVIPILSANFFFV